MEYCPNYDQPIPPIKMPLSPLNSVRESALFSAVRTGGDITFFLNMLSKFNIDINCRDKDGYTPLHWAQDARTVLSLLDRGADANTRDKDGNTPLHCAAIQGNEEIVDILTIYSADVNVKGRGGCTPLHLSGSTEVAGLLIRHGADVNAKDHNDYTPLHVATKECHTEVAKLLIENGADVNARDKSGYIPLHYAIEKQCKEIENLLIKHIKHIDIHWAVEHGYQGVVESLIKQGANIDAKDSSGYTPLHWAKSAEMVDFLIKHGAGVNSKDNNGYTTLHWAAKQGYQEIVELLIKYKADTVKNKDGKMPSELATNELIRAKLESYEKGKELEEIKDQTNKEKEEMKAALEKNLKETEEKLKEVTDEKTTALEKLLKLQKDMRELEKEQPVIEKVLLDVKEEFNKCNLAQKLETITNKLEEIEKDMPEIAAYYSTNQSRFENVINNILSNAELLNDNKMKSNIVTTVGEMLDMLKKCGSQSEEKLYLVTDKIDYIKENMPKIDTDFEIESYLALM